MKKLFALVFASILLIGSSCSHKDKETTASQHATLDSTSVTVFARQMVYSVTHGDATFCNEAFDKKGIRQKISSNSLVNSSLDTDFGRDYFEYNFHYGDQLISILEAGGDIYFQKYYQKEGKHHILIRTYQDFGIKMEDFIVDTVGNELKITDGFLYNVSTTFSDYVQYLILYNILQKTDPEGLTKYFTESNQLLQDKKGKEALQLLEKQQEYLKEYPFYTQQIIQAAFLAQPATFPQFINQYEGLDPRTRLTHLLLFYANGGYVSETEQTIEQLIDLTADDPIYLFFFARANVVAKKYRDALLCLDNLGKALPPLWDIWEMKADCLYHLNENEAFTDYFIQGKDLYELTDEELVQLCDKKYPKMLQKVKEKLAEKEEKSTKTTQNKE